MACTDCQIIRSDRKTIAIQITPKGEVIVRCPRRMADADVQTFLEQKRAWIQKQLSQCKPAEPFSQAELNRFRQQTRSLVTQLAAHYAPIVGVDYGRITVRAQRTRWGSCSSKGKLNFNCLLALVPAQVADYIVVHELCHRREMNHSPRFWAEVEKVLPDYRSCEQWLKRHGRDLIARL